MSLFIIFLDGLRLTDKEHVKQMREREKKQLEDSFIIYEK